MAGWKGLGGGGGRGGRYIPLGALEGSGGLAAALEASILRFLRS